MNARTSDLTQSFTYDFTGKPGLIGVYNTGIQLPPCMVYYFALVITTAIPAGAGVITVGYAGATTAFGCPQAAGPVINSPLAPALINTTVSSVTITITVADIVSGAIRMYFKYWT